MTLCGSSRGVFESKRATCLRDKAPPSIGSTSHLLPVHHRIGCLLPKSRHHHAAPHRCKPAIYGASNLTTATLEARFAQQSALALVTACGSGAHSFAWAARGCASGPARRMLGRADEHGWGTRDAGRWPWRASSGVIKRAAEGSQRSVRS